MRQLATATALILSLIAGGSVLADGIRVVDREVRYATQPDDPNHPPRPAPMFEGTRLPITSLPNRVKSSGGWEENLYSSSGEQTTIKAPGKDWILHLVLTTRGIDDTDTGSLDYKIWYRTSRDGGKTYSTLKQLVQRGDEYNDMHPIDGVWVGRNGFVYGGRLQTASNGEIIVPTYRWPVDENKKPLNPHGAYTYMESGALIGRWTEDGSDVVWECGQFVRPEADESTRGSDESAIIELETPGHFMMVARGSNQNKPEFPGRKWFSESKDYCRTWTKPVPWTDAKGEPFFSPASHGSIIHSRKNGRLYWIGNLTPENPDGNHPRFPLVIGEIDRATQRLKRETLVTIDTRNEQFDTDKMQLSNFTTTEDPQTGNLLITLTRYDTPRPPAGGDASQKPRPDPTNWYLIELPGS